MNDTRRCLLSATHSHLFRSCRHGRLLPCVALALLSLLGLHRAAAADFAPPKPEELSMTSLPGYPGAAAVVLFREEIDNDDLHFIQRYERLKVLTEDGKKYANVELKTLSAEQGDNLVAEDIQGRTIHPDGKIIPFTGKPYFKVLEKGDGIRLQEKVFTLPDVEVGSIIEYRYSVRPDMYYMAPSWYIQGSLYLKEAHFEWLPTTRDLIDAEGRAISSISWFPLLPAGTQVQRREMPGNSRVGGGASQVYEVHVKDMPPQIQEDHMPPLENYSYRVLFNFTPFRTAQEFWKDGGKNWSKGIDKFANPGALRGPTEQAIAGANTSQEKLQKIYAAVMKLDNTDFTRTRNRQEEKAAGQGEIHNAADVFSHERGTPTELTELFIGMARAAGFKAYAMLVPDRSERLFTQNWLSFSQFDTIIAIVDVDGKEEFFDPGERYCAYGQVAWEHTFVQGLRQTDGGTDFAMGPADSYKLNHTSRVANLTMAADGQVSGKLDFSYTGAPALHWRQMAARADEQELRQNLHEDVERMVPSGLELEVADIKNLTNYDQPLLVTFKVTGSMGRSMGKRVLLPSDLFLATDTAEFPQQKRELPVYFHYPQAIQDATRINFDKSLTVEAIPSAAKLQMPEAAIYTMNVTQAPTNVTMRRDFYFAGVVIPVKDYKELRDFYSQLQIKDQENIVLKSAPGATASLAEPTPTHP